MNDTIHTSENGGTTHVIDVNCIDVNAVDTPQEAAALAGVLDAAFERYVEAVADTLEALRDTVDTATVDLPDCPIQVPLTDFGGREWVVQYEDAVSMPVLAKMVLLVEYKTLAESARQKCALLHDRFEATETNGQVAMVDGPAVSAPVDPVANDAPTALRGFQ